VLARDASIALHAVHEHAEAGKDLGRLMSDFISHLRDLLVLKANPEGLADELSAEVIAALQSQADGTPMEKLLDLIEQFASAEGRMKWAPNKKMHFEVAVIRAIQTLQSATLTDVLETLTALRGGSAPAAAKPAAPVRPAPKPVAPATSPVVREPEPAPPAPAPAPTAAPAVASGDFWPAFVNAVRQQRKLISAWVEAGALIGIEGDVVRLGFPPDQSFAKDFLEQSHLAFLEDAAGALLGRRVTMKLALKDGITVAAPAPAAPPRDPMEEFKSDPLIKKALEIFKAEIQPA
jgi:DNA polymerase III subunit gamma/tau